MNIVAIGEEEQDFFSINLAHIPDLTQPEPIPPAKCIHSLYVP